MRSASEVVAISNHAFVGNIRSPIANFLGA
jgi:hypothetical protein